MCHTDRRSPKAGQIGASAALAWLFYDPVHKLQLRVSGQGRVLDDDDPLTSEQWQRSRVGSRRCYLAPLAPGTPCDVPESGLPRAPLTGSLTREQSEAGRVNFAVVACEASTMDVLQLGAHGHLRLRLQWTAAGSEAGWVAP
jgi:3-hydroxyisobutyrate dehydrogenase